MWHPESIFDASGHLDEGVVHAWLDGQLAPDTAAQVEQHARGCAACSAMVAEARGLVAGASRVMSSLDEPAAGHAPLHGAPVLRNRMPSRWSTRRVRLAAAAALVFVTATLVLRDAGGVREMIQGEGQVLDSGASAPRPTQVAPTSAQSSDAAPEATAAEPLPAAASAAAPVAASPPAGRVGAVSGASTNRGVDAQAAFRSPSAPPAAQISSAAPPPAPASPRADRAPAVPIAEGGTVPRRREVAANAAGLMERSSSAAARTQSVRTSGEIQAMVSMVSSCWRIAGSDSVLELLPPGSTPRMAAPDEAETWIPGWLRIGRDATNPDRIWWLPLRDSVSARVRSSDAVAPDLIITPQAGRASLRRVPRADTPVTMDPDSPEPTAETAESVPCASP